MSLEAAIEQLKNLYALGYKGELVINFTGTSIADAYLNKQRLTEQSRVVVAK